MKVLKHIKSMEFAIYIGKNKTGRAVTAGPVHKTKNNKQKHNRDAVTASLFIVFIGPEGP